jgi:hypothetical protein
MLEAGYNMFAVCTAYCWDVVRTHLAIQTAWTQESKAAYAQLLEATKNTRGKGSSWQWLEWWLG